MLYARHSFFVFVWNLTRHRSINPFAQCSLQMHTFGKKLHVISLNFQSNLPQCQSWLSIQCTMLALKMHMIRLQLQHWDIYIVTHWAPKQKNRKMLNYLTKLHNLFIVEWTKYPVVYQRVADSYYFIPICFLLLQNLSSRIAQSTLYIFHSISRRKLMNAEYDFYTKN